MKVYLPEKDYSLDELYYQIQVFEAYNNRKPQYIVMSERTLQLIECHEQYNYRVGQDVYFKHNIRYIGEIFGISVAYNHGLDFGMVDIV